MLFIVIPYRNREKHLHNIIECLYYRFREKNIPIFIFVSEQANNNPFNVGFCRNIGFDMGLKILRGMGLKPDKVLFNDVDCYPETELAVQEYCKNVDNGFVNHIYGRSMGFYGGIWSISISDFKNHECTRW